MVFVFYFTFLIKRYLNFIRLSTNQRFSIDYSFMIKVEKTKKDNSWLKIITITTLIIFLTGAGIYWYIADERFSDTSNRKSMYTVNAMAFIKEFQTNDSIANIKYSDKIITVTGMVSEVEAADTTANIKIIDPATGSYAIFAFQEQHLSEAKKIQAGDSVSIKGSCSGSIFSNILGTEVISFKRCALNKK